MDPRRLLPLLTALAGSCVLLTLAAALVRAGDSPAPDRGAERAPAASQRPPGPAGILAAWDRRRASAWAAGDPRMLADLYVAGSRTAAADLRLLRHYRPRGLAVTDLATQVLRLQVVERSEARLVLVVTDRVVGGRAVVGGTAIALPADRASTRRIVLVRQDGAWLVAEARDQSGDQARNQARDQARAAASTSRTSSSSKS